ncbi:cytochrome P450 2K1-like isoform X2 [Brienomyrus brachyistius]|uniref:cytochrome P450 2K1-like isoform X2 n=1 Tax=Brienomyrus brachyistius TaxID=42636 RepID=UPI0020B2DD76|nr:cytochrome P450 2K1-like isoform X2 [Brienomyrus brachyistius]
MAVVQELFQIPSLVTLLVSVLVLLILYLLINTQNRGKEPPGPRPLPLLGNLLQLDLKTLHLSLFQLSQKYGPVYTIHFGPKKTVVVAGYQAVKEALINLGEEFGDREIPPVFKDYAKGHGSPFDNTEELMHTTCNIISSIIYGDRFDYEDPHFQEMVTQTKRNVQLMASPGVLIYDMFPWLGWWLKDRKVLMEGFKFTLTQIKQMIGKLRETLNLEERRGFVDSFLIHQQKIKKSREKVSAYYHDENLLMSVANLFAAGTDTTANTLRWGLLLMAKYPHVQDRVQEELDRVIGGRQTRVEDRKNLPYTDAVIHEIQRVAQVTPLVRHSTSCDVVLQGYSIKKGTAVTLLLSSVLSDESEWESPNTFNPGHFLDDQGLFKKRDAFMPFSAGRRLCIGESLARMEIFLFFTTLLQRFHFTPPPGVSVSDLDLTPVFGFTVSPTPHTLCAQPRVRS